MTVSSELNRKQYAGNGVTTSFATSPVVFFDSSDLDVYVVTTATGAATLLTETTDYTVSGGDGSTGTVSLAGLYGAPSASQTLVIVRNVPLTQATDFVQNDASDAEVQEDALDKLTMADQQLSARLDRSFTLADSDVSGASLTVPTPEANSLVGWNSAGTALENKTAADIDLATVTAFIETLLDDASASAARSTLGAAASGANADITSLSLPLHFGGRLTLATATPVTTSDQAGKTTIYFTPYNGDSLPIYDGTNMVQTTFAELSQATTDTTKSPAAVTTDSNYDLFVWNDGGTIRLSRGPAWTSDTGRGTGAGTTELTTVKGVYVNANAIANGPAANKGTYVGSVRSNGSSQIDWKLGSAASGGGAAFLGVWNMYNRVDVTTNSQDTDDSWTYQSTTPRSMNNSVGNRVSLVVGLDEDGIEVTQFTHVLSSATEGAAVALGLDSTSSVASKSSKAAAASSAFEAVSVRYAGNPGIGFHYVQALEFCSGAVNPCTFYGDAGASHVRQLLTARVRA